MAVAKSAAGVVLDVVEVDAKTETLFKSGALRVMRLVVPAHKLLDTHKAAGEVTLYCVSGRVTLFVEGVPNKLSAGQLAHLPPGVPHAVRGEEDAVLLLSIVAPNEIQQLALDVVEEASEESFPASDAPSHTPVTRP